MQTPNIYNIIQEQLGNSDTLPSDFSIFRQENGDVMPFADGALDGTLLYHSADPNVSDGEIDELFILLVDACRQQGGQWVRPLEDFMKGRRMLPIAQPLLSRIRRSLRSERSPLSNRALYDAGATLATTATHIEAAKAGLTILSLFKSGSDENARRIFLTFAKSEEFTLYCVRAMANWPDGNERIWELAQKLSGWGKIHAVEKLEPVMPEIRRWILAYGCQNTVSSSYLGLTCARKGGLLEALQDPSLSDEVFDGAGFILSAMMDEGQMLGLRAYTEGAQAVSQYLELSVSRCNSLDRLAALFTIYFWLHQLESDGERREYQARHNTQLCHNIIDNHLWQYTIRAGLAGGDLREALLSVRLADYLQMDVYDEIFQLLELNPVKYADLLWYICRHPGYAEKTTRLYEHELSLETISCGPDSLLGVGPQFASHRALQKLLQELGEYTCISEELVLAGLESPVLGVRNSALQLLLSWRYHLQQPVYHFMRSAYDVLEKNLSTESSMILQKHYHDLLESESDEQAEQTARRAQAVYSRA